MPTSGEFNFSPGGFWSAVAPPQQSHVAVAVTAIAGVVLFAAVVYTSRRGHLRSPWSLGRRKSALSPRQWRNFFTPEGKLCDGGAKLLKRVRSGGIHPSIRAEVWPFLLDVYDLNSTKDEREVVRTQKRKEYKKLRKKCKQLLRCIDENSSSKGKLNLKRDTHSPSSEVVSAQESLSSEERTPEVESDDHSTTVIEGDNSSTRATDENSSSKGKHNLSQDAAQESLSNEEKMPEVESDDHSSTVIEGDNNSRRATDDDTSDLNSEVTGSDSEDPEIIQDMTDSECREGQNKKKPQSQGSETNIQSKHRTQEDFATWQRIIRLDAVRANAEWIPYSPSQAMISDSKARHAAEDVGLKDYDHLEPCRIFHAARLVAILEAYAVYDPEIGYCQGMSDLLTPIITVITEDYEAFWCFVGFMKKARHNFRLDEVGIRRQLNIVAKIIKHKDYRLYKHLEMLQAEDCFFVYRMVVVLFRRELTFEQTLCLWEVMWADQAAIRAGIGTSSWSKIIVRAPPTDDLLLYAIAASVLQRRKLIIEKYNAMDEILRECNNMAGQLDVWKLLDDAHELVVNLHDKI